jgi:hypothetical protein
MLDGETGALERTEVLHPVNDLPGEVFRWLVPIVGHGLARQLISLVTASVLPRSAEAS